MITYLKPSEKSTLKFCNKRISEISYQVNMKILLFTIKSSKNYEVKIPFFNQFKKIKDLEVTVNMIFKNGY